ncbi:sigma 54-interacting transcriptional regulator [Sorangium sp. So ce1389]|uniref:sigma 54-interacting transcriptional regulator n=1 Tax=Sorangium sp. So ce1389 TaxID=3133336 RepID=UPI003F5E6EB9
MGSGAKSALGETTLESQGTASALALAAETPALTILCHPLLDRVGERALLGEIAEGGVALVSRVTPAFAAKGQSSGSPLEDGHLSRRPFRLSAAGGDGIRLEIGDSGTAVVAQGRRIRESTVFSAAQVKRGVVLELSRRVVLLLHRTGGLHALPQDAATEEAVRELVGESDGLRRMLWEIRSVADQDLPVLLRGETGVGKELAARAVHVASLRRSRPFVAVNLGAIAPSLAIAELFGAERGAYTGADRRQTGYFERAHGGTLFLDEIGEAPPELQVALLRALETGEIQPAGAQQARRVDVRVIAATDADLAKKVANGTFRAPLLNRLLSYEIWIPPLRERRDDIGRLLVRFFREELARIGETHRLAPPGPQDTPWLPASVVARLADHDWPGNVRELRNVVRQLVLGSRGQERLVVGPAVERQLREAAQAGAPLAPEEAPVCEVTLPGGEAAPPSREVGPPSGKLAPPSGKVAPPSAPEAQEGSPSGKVAPPSAPEAQEGSPRAAAPWRKPADVPEAEVAEALRASRWDLSAAAARLHITRPSLYQVLQRSPSFRTARDLTAEEIRRCHEACGGDVGRMVEQLEVSERALRRRLREMGIE